MADIPFSQVSGGANFQTDGLVYELIASGQTGELISLPEVSGKVYKITTLATDTASTQAGISLTTNGNVIENEKILADGASVFSSDATTFAVVSITGGSSSALAYATAYKSIECSSFSIDKNTGNTTEPILLCYEIGEYK